MYVAQNFNLIWSPVDTACCVGRRCAFLAVEHVSVQRMREFGRKRPCAAGQTANRNADFTAIAFPYTMARNLSVPAV